MEGLNCDVQNIIYRYKHNLLYKDVIEELNKISNIWCCIYLKRRYGLNTDAAYYKKSKATFSDLNDYEKTLMRYFSDLNDYEIALKRYFRFYDINFEFYKPPLLYLYRHYL